MNSHNSLKPGVYEVTRGEYLGAAIFLIEVSEPEASEFVYMTIFNPNSKESHEISSEEWRIMTEQDGLVWSSDIPNEIKDMYLQGSFAILNDLN